MASVTSFWVSPLFAVKSENRHQCRAQVRNLGGGDSTVLSSDSVGVSGASLVGRKEENGSLIEQGNVMMRSGDESGKTDSVLENLGLFWDDGYGTQSVEDYFDAATEIIKPDGGPPRWFCPVDCGHPLKDSPTLLFLPGLDGTGMGLVLHHKALGKAFEVRCLHIPVYDRTPFQGLVKLVEDTIRLEHASTPNKPIYLVGDSFGGCLALAVAARNPTIDLVLILANPATSFGRSQLQPLFPILEALPDELHVTIPYLLSFIMGDPIKMAMVNIQNKLPPAQRFEELSRNLTALLPYLTDLADIVPRETLLWKLKLLKSAAAYANSRLHAVKAEVLVLASGKDNMLPSANEAQRLTSSLHDCIVRNFKDNGHTLLLEDGISLLTIIRGTCKYRRSRRHDLVLNFIPPSMNEITYTFDQVVGSIRAATGPVMFSTMEDGKIVKGLAGVPDEGPVLLIGYHMLMGIEIFSLAEEFLRKKNILVRGIAHPELFMRRFENSSTEFSVVDWLKIFGAVPVTAAYLYKLLSTKSHVLLYPGGAREALHYKGEEYKLFWPHQQEFVRMAARFGATIVPFGTVGEDDLTEMVLDYNDLIKIPIVNDLIRDANRTTIKFRDETQGEVASQDIFIPAILPKIPGRFYYLFGKPIQTKGREEFLKDKDNANQLYLQIKSEVERNLNYLIKKREQDPYRSIINRKVYEAIYGTSDDIPTFEP
ncbi:Acyltransferase-like protein, chloroplastic [Quillaja saponaria]|uniref:Acyltransferase-like protein, chloroplastic n=1 Tax=Quillaja saponaria TaxID=32244 RepID=A0AAD7QBX0_QUISA|nr:Acyltransferase-like protein, chloroplastic [Quillaja saponaria]